ncbi:MAG: NAD(P)H-dependent oxidoreductase [Acidimicrobiia bacterium]
MLRYAASVAPAGMTVDIADISEIPMFNMDVRAEVGYPEAVAEVRRKLQDAAGLLIATPEYNNSMTGVLKNTIDWLSTGADSPLDRKPTAILGAGGRLGTSRSQAALRVVLANNNVAVLNRPEVLLAGASSLFDDDLNLTDERSQDQVRRLMFALGGQIRLHQSRDQAVVLGDDNELLSGAARLLDEAGYEVHTTTDPAWAVSQLKSGGLSLCVLESPYSDNEEVTMLAADTDTRVVVIAGIDDFLDALDEGST